MNEMNLKDLEQNIPMSAAQAAHAGTSHVPERRADAERASYAAQLLADFDALQKLAPGKDAELGEQFARYRAGYRAHFLVYLGARSRCLSAMITGPANFPAARNSKRWDSADRRAQALADFRRRALKAIRRKLRPDLGPIMASNPQAVDLLAQKVEHAEKVQERMKAANVAIRKHAKEGAPAQVAALVALGFTHLQAEKLLLPDFCGRVGFPSYALTNNAANIRRMKLRAAQVTRAKAAPVKTVEGTAARLEDCPPENRVRLFFPGKPAEDVRAKLKARGFRWTPSLGCWQAYRNAWSLQTAQEVACPAATPARQTFAERLADKSKSEVAEAFAAWVRAVAVLNGMTDTDVWYAWRDHSDQNAAMDQSATKFEFCLWRKLHDPERESVSEIGCPSGYGVECKSAACVARRAVAQ